MVKKIIVGFMMLVLALSAGAVEAAREKKPAKKAAVKNKVAPKKAFRKAVKKAPAKAVKKGVKQVNLPIGVSLRVVGQNMNVTFSNLKNIATVNYILSYESEGIPEGVVGTVSGGKNISRSLYFGTCSSGVCRAHTGITNAQLEVNITYKNGKTQTGYYPIKI